MPLGDPQFWIVTLLALAALAVLVKAAWPRRTTRRKADLTVSAHHDNHQDPDGRDQPPGAG